MVVFPLVQQARLGADQCSWAEGVSLPAVCLGLERIWRSGSLLAAATPLESHSCLQIAVKTRALSPEQGISTSGTNSKLLYIFFQVYLKGINSWYQGAYHQPVRNWLNMKNKQLEESVPKQKLLKEATTVGVSSVTVCQQHYVTHQLCSLGAFELFPLLTKGFCCSRQLLSPWWGSQLEAAQQQQHQVHPEVRISACSPRMSRPWFGFPARSYCFSYCPEDADARCWFFF